MHHGADAHARRAAREGHAFRYSPHDYETFAADFGFEETADQKAAIHCVIQDMISPRPMDRLICGDVGFGKTEVALRAAFVAVMGGMQVAFLAPTTLLAEQHYQTLVDRFGKWPVRIAEMSRILTVEGEVLVIPDPDDHQNAHRRNILGRVASWGDGVADAAYGKQVVAITVEERL